MQTARWRGAAVVPGMAPGAVPILAALLTLAALPVPRVAGATQVADTAGADLQIPRATEITLEPEEVLAGMFFDGATVQVRALVPGDMAITVSCLGNQEPVTLGRKGKALGLIWMNVGEVEIEGAPDLYLLNTSEPLDELAAPAMLAAVGVGYGALEGRTRLRGTEGDDALYFQEFVSLKESDGLYAVAEEAVDRTDAGAAGTTMSTELRLSPKTPPGEYEILIHGFGAREGVLLGRIPLRVRQVGMAASIRTLAMDHGLLYGVLAVVVAIVVGLLTGVLFGLGSKKAH
jgi:uncharacterized protein (TIGR02186 family)